jgi:DNA-binding NarL/FixJ family response regulator
MDLVRLGAMLAHDPRARFDHIALTPSKEHVLELVGRGLSNAEIAKLRSRSARTIANQVASLLRKTRLPSRRALATRVSKTCDVDA